jgi:hypothetical protein
MASKSSIRKPKPSRGVGQYVQLAHGGQSDTNPFGPSNISSYVGDPLFQADRALVKHRYAEAPYKWTVSSLSTEFERYRLNDLFDPYVGTGGGSPSGFTLMSSQYTYFRVHKSRIKVQLNRAEHTFDDSLFVAIAPLPYGAVVSPPTSIEQLIAQPYSKHKVMTGAFGNKSSIELSHTMTVEKIQGERDIYTSAYSGGAATSPVIVPEWVIGIFNSNTGANAILDVQVTVDYWSEWTVRRSAPLALIERALRFYAINGKEEEKKVVSVLIPRIRTSKTRISSVEPPSPVLCSCHKVAFRSCPSVGR